MFVKNTKKFTLATQEYHRFTELLDIYKFALCITCTRKTACYEFTDENAQGLMEICKHFLNNADKYMLDDYAVIVFKKVLWQVDTYFGMRQVPASLVFEYAEL